MGRVTLTNSDKIGDPIRVSELIMREHVTIVQRDTSVYRVLDEPSNVLDQLWSSIQNVIKRFFITQFGTSLICTTNPINAYEISL